MAVYADDYIPVIKFNGLTIAHPTVALPATTTIGGSTVSALGVITSASANALTVGLNGSTNPSFNVDSSTATQAAGLNVVGAVAAGTVALASISSGAAASISLNGKGAGQTLIGNTSTGLVSIGRGATKGIIFSGTVTDYDLQAATVTIAGLLGGIVTQNSKTGASTITTPTGTEISAGISGVTVGDIFYVTYSNRGNQTSTITAGASGVTLAGTVAVPTLKTAWLTFICTGSNAWTCYIILSA